MEHLSPVPGGIQGLQAAISRAFFPYEVEGGPLGSRFECAMGHRRLGPLRLTRTRVNGPFMGRRREGPSNDPGTYSILYIEEGGDVELYAARHAIARSGSLVLLSSLQPLETEQVNSGTSLAISIAAGPLRARLPDIEDRCFISADASTGAGAILRDTLTACWRVGDTVIDGTDDLASSLAYLIGATFRPQDGRACFGSEAAYGHCLRIRDYVIRHVDVSSLSAAHVAADLGISKSYLFAIMNAAGTTLGRLIMESRLDRGRALLQDASARHWTIAEVAAAAGFRDAAHFSRSFAKHFGAPPRSFRCRHGAVNPP